MASKRKSSLSEGKHGLPPLKPPPMLKRKSSSLSVLDHGTGASGNGAEQKAALPRVERNTGSLQDLRPIDGDNNSRTHNNPQGKNGDKKKKPITNGWSTAESGDSLPMVAKTSGSQADIKPTSAKGQRVRTRRRHDIVLTRPATIAVVVKYQCKLKWSISANDVCSTKLTVVLV